MHALQRILRINRGDGRTGVMAACTANRWAIRAVLVQARQDRTLALVEATARQVNLAGGYAGMRPADFARLVQQEAARVGLAPRQILLGGDHVGPDPWHRQTATEAMGAAGALTAELVRCGFAKLHLDPTAPCVDDPTTADGSLPLELIIQRTAGLVAVAEEAARRFQRRPPLYVVGSDVPSPGGRSEPLGKIAVSSSAGVREMLAGFRQVLTRAGLQAAWPRVVAVVVRPGIDFSSQSVAAYNPRRTVTLVRALQDLPGLVYEAHSTDFQTFKALQRMVADHFAVLKVGPGLTFAFREATFALARIEAEALNHRKGLRLSRLIETVESEMLRDPIHWQRHYHGQAAHKAILRRYAYSDRIRYYWSRPPVRAAFSRLLTNLRRYAVPEPLVRQYLPGARPSEPDIRFRPDPEDLIVDHIRHVTRHYAAACGTSATRATHSR